MSNTSFAFKQFTVNHDKCAMKVGTDGVLLGAWAPVAKAKHILDVGTGTGLIALQLAQRNQYAKVIAVEIDPSAASQAKENVDCSPWADRIDAQGAGRRACRAPVLWPVRNRCALELQEPAFAPRHGRAIQFRLGHVRPAGAGDHRR